MPPAGCGCQKTFRWSARGTAKVNTGPACASAQGGEIAVGVRGAMGGLGCAGGTRSSLQSWGWDGCGKPQPDRQCRWRRKKRHGGAQTQATFLPGTTKPNYFCAPLPIPIQPGLRLHRLASSFGEASRRRDPERPAHGPDIGGCIILSARRGSSWATGIAVVVVSCRDRVRNKGPPVKELDCFKPPRRFQTLLKVPIDISQ